MMKWKKNNHYNQNKIQKSQIFATIEKQSDTWLLSDSQNFLISINRGYKLLNHPTLSRLLQCYQKKIAL